MNNFWRPIKLKTAFTSRVLQDEIRRHIEIVAEQHPDLLPIYKQALRESEELIIEVDKDAFTPEQIANFDY